MRINKVTLTPVGADYRPFGVVFYIPPILITFIISIMNVTMLSTACNRRSSIQ